MPLFKRESLLMNLAKKKPFFAIIKGRRVFLFCFGLWGLLVDYSRFPNIQSKTECMLRARWFSSTWERKGGMWLWVIPPGFTEQSTRPTALWFQFIQKTKLLQLTVLFGRHSYHKIDPLAIRSKCRLPILKHYTQVWWHQCPWVMMMHQCTAPYLFYSTH